MNERSALDLLEDARSFTLEAREFATGHGPDTFAGHRREQLAVRYCLAVVDEALNEVPKDVQALAPVIPWAAVYGLRNRPVHGYWLIDTPTILSITQTDIDPLVTSIDRLRKQIE